MRRRHPVDERVRELAEDAVFEAQLPQAVARERGVERLSVGALVSARQCRGDGAEPREAGRTVVDRDEEEGRGR